MQAQVTQMDMFPAPPAPAPSIASRRHGVMTYKQWSLAAVPVDTVSQLLGFRPNGLPSCDGKVTAEWNFVADGQPCSIWDYRGARWSAYGPREVFEALGLLPVEA